MITAPETCTAAPLASDTLWKQYVPAASVTFAFALSARSPVGVHVAAGAAAIAAVGVFGFAVPPIVPLFTIAEPAVTSPVTIPDFWSETPPCAERTSPPTVELPMPTSPLLTIESALGGFAPPYAPEPELKLSTESSFPFSDRLSRPTR